MWVDWIPGILMLVLFALETPIAFAIAISALSFFLIDGGVPLNIFVQKMVSATDSYPLLAIPFFVLAGAIMNKAGITRRLLALADAPPSVLVHEHVMVDFVGAADIVPGRYDPREVARIALPHLRAIRALGCRRLLECTPNFLARDPRGRDRGLRARQARLPLPPGGVRHRRHGDGAGGRGLRPLHRLHRTGRLPADPPPFAARRDRRLPS